MTETIPLSLAREIAEHKACPFCGGSELVNDGHFVGCDDCGAAGPCTYPVPDNKKSMELWDRRVKEVSCKNT